MHRVIPESSENFTFWLVRKLPRLKDRKWVNIISIWTHLRSFNFGALAQPKCKILTRFWCKQVKYLQDYKLALTFENGITKIVDLADHLGKGIFKPLKDISYFKTVRIDDELDTIVWDNGADISPDFLYHIGQNISANKKAI